MNSVPKSGNYKEIKKTEPESTSEINEKYQTLVENLSVGVYRNTSGPKGHFLEINSKVVSMFEAKSKEEFMKHNVSDFYQHPEERKQFIEELMKKGEVKNKELNLVTLKGKKIICSVTTIMKKDTKGNVYFDGIIEDITEHKKKEKEYKDSLDRDVKMRTLELKNLNQKLYSEILRRENVQKSLQAANNELENTTKAMVNIMEDQKAAKEIVEIEKVKDEAILASIGEGLIAVDNNKKIIVVNKAAEKMLGFSKKELLGKTIDSIHLQDEEGNIIDQDKRPINESLAKDKFVNSICYFVRKDKTRFPAAIDVTPIKLGKKIIGGVDVFRDITREKEIDQSKSEFVSLASHQLRTPLGIIKWYIEALENNASFKTVSPTIHKYFEEIYKNNERVLILVRDLLSVSRIEQGHIKNKPKLVDVIKLLNDIVDQMKILAHKKNVVLKLTIKDQKQLMIYIDILRFHEAIENIITNAIEYSFPKGSVVISLSKESDKILISVTDTGIGITDADLKKIFTKFFRSEKAIAHHPEGAGLGLYVVKEYVQDWGGTIKAKSVDGKGSTFTISIPIEQKNLKGGEKK